MAQKKAKRVRATKKATPKPKRRTMAKAFDEWMRRFVEEPEKFEQTIATVKRFVTEGGMEGEATTYGENCTALLKHLMAGG